MILVRFAAGVMAGVLALAAELETATGEWVDSRMLAKQALAMLDGGSFVSAGRIARN